MNLPLHDTEPIHFAPEPEEAQQALDAALRSEPGERELLLRDAVAAHPTLLEGWGRLAEVALHDGRAVEAYAYARVGYHRGLDRARASGWKGQGTVPGDHPHNRGFLLSVHLLGRAADAIGEVDEAQRCDSLLAELDPDDGLGVR